MLVPGARGGSAGPARHVAALPMWMLPASHCDEILLLWRCLAAQVGPAAGPDSALGPCRDEPSFRRYPAVDW